MIYHRWYGLWTAERHAFRRKRIGIIMTYGDTDLYNAGGLNAIHTFESMFPFIRGEITGIVHGSLMDIGGAQKHPELMQAAYDPGKKLTAAESRLTSHTTWAVGAVVSSRGVRLATL